MLLHRFQSSYIIMVVCIFYDHHFNFTTKVFLKRLVIKWKDIMQAITFNGSANGGKKRMTSHIIEGYLIYLITETIAFMT